MEGKAERRKCKRYLAKDRAAVIVTSNAGNKAYNLVDISMQGLSFRYLGEEQLPNEPMEINIVYNDEFHLMKAPVKSTSDSSLENNFMPMRRWGAQFMNLSPIQKSQLEDFIRHYAANEAAQAKRMRKD